MEHTMMVLQEVAQPVHQILSALLDQRSQNFVLLVLQLIQLQAKQLYLTALPAQRALCVQDMVNLLH